MSSASQTLAEAHGPEMNTQAKSLWHLLQEGVVKNPRGLALACPQHPAKDLSDTLGATNDHSSVDVGEERDSLEWSYSQISMKAEALAENVHRLGAAAQGATIVPFLASGPEWALWFWAAAKLSMPVAAVDPKVLFSEAAIPTASGKDPRGGYIQALHPHIVIVRDDISAAAYDEASRRNNQTPALKVITDPHSVLSPSLDFKAGGWVTLGELIRSPTPIDTNGYHEQRSHQAAADPQDVARILFTGGSTGDPKGCPHTHANLTAESHGFNSMRGLTTASRTLIQSPVHHIMANAAALLSWRAGAGVVFPFNGNQFDAGHSIQAIETYQCTYLPVHHSMSDAILRHPSFSKEALESVRYMQIGGALIGAGLASQYKASFGVARDGTSSLEIFPFWGSTEGMYTTSCVKGDALVIDHRGTKDSEPEETSSDLLAVGRAYTGGRVKVVDPDTGSTLARGYGDECVGELHFGGNTVIKRYLGGMSPESFYTEGGFPWFRTGDQGRMAPDGSVFMLGRYKDMIKRGGENIFPQQLEYTLKSTCGTDTQIIGIPDAITGEACVAVVDASKSDHFSKLQLQIDVSKNVGPEFIFAHILTLQDLEISGYPLGPGGKVRKPALKKLVLEHLHKAERHLTVLNGNTTPRPKEQGQDHWIELVKSIWADLLHIDSSEFQEDFRLEHFTDSLTAMRYCFEVERLTSKRLTVADVRNSPTIRSQAKLVSGAGAETHAAGRPEIDGQQRTGPPALADVLACRGQESKFRQVQELAKAALDLHGLTWERDVQECFGALPLWGGTILLPRTRTFNLRFAFEVRGLQFWEVREALVKILKIQPLLASTGINLDNRLLYLQLRPSEQVLNLIITKEPEYGSVGEAVDHGLHDPFSLVTHPPELLARFGISPIAVEDPGEGPVHVITLSFAHSTCDGMTNSVIIAELDAQINMLLAKKAGKTMATRHISPRFIPYKLVCEMSEALDYSVAAQTSRQLVASRFRGIAEDAGTAWPLFEPSQVLSIFGSDASGKSDICRGGIIVQKSARAPGILSLQQAHGISPAVALKVAYGLAVMQMTGKRTALFLRADAARHWPFQDAWTQAQLPNPLLLGGPTVVLAWERLRLGHDGGGGGEVTLGDVLLRVRAEDDEMAPHTHVFGSHEGLIARLSPEDAAFVRDARPFDPKIAFNHVPDVGRFTGADGLRALKLRGTSFFGTGVTALQCGFDAGDRELCVIAGIVDDSKWDDAEAEVGGFEEKILATLANIVKPESWDAPAFTFAEPVAG